MEADRSKQITMQMLKYSLLGLPGMLAVAFGILGLSSEKAGQ